MNHHEYYTIKHTRKTNQDQYKSLMGNQKNPDNDQNSDIHIPLNKAGKAETPILRDYNEIKKMMSGYLSPDGQKGLQVLTRHESGSQLPSIKATASQSPFIQGSKKQKRSAKEIDEMKQMIHSKEAYSVLSKNSMPSMPASTPNIPKIKYGSQAWQKQQSTQSIKSFRKGDESKSRMFKNNRTSDKDLGPMQSKFGKEE